MATLLDSIVRQSCGSAVLGTGTKYCDFNPKDIEHVVFTPKSLSIPLTEDFDLAYFEGLQLAGNAVLLKNAFEFTDSTADNTKQTSATGKIQISQKGRNEFSLKYTDGMALYKALQSLDSRGSYRVILIDSENNWMFTEDGSDAIKGFLTTYIASEAVRFDTGSEVTSKMLSFQLAIRDEMDERSAWIQNEFTLFNVQAADGVNELVYSFKTAPANSDTTIIANVYSMVNRSVDVSTILDTETTAVQVYVNGVSQVPSVVARTGINELTITITPALSTSDVVYMAADPFSITDAGLFKAGKSAEAIVV